MEILKEGTEEAAPLTKTDKVVDEVPDPDEDDLDDLDGIR